MGSSRFSPRVATALAILSISVLVGGAPQARADDAAEVIRRLLGWGWEDRPHGPTLASDVLGEFERGDPARPNYGSYGPYGGPTPHAFFFFAFNAGRYQVVGGLAAHQAARKLAVPDYWNHRVLLFDLNTDGTLAGRKASALIGQRHFDEMEIGRGPDRLHYPSACAFDAAAKFLFVADEYNHRVLQFPLDDPRRAVRVYGQRDFDSWGIDASPGELVWDSTREDVRGPRLVRAPNARGMFLPRGVASDGRRLFVADDNNHRVLVFDATGTENGPEAVAVLGQADHSGYRPNRGGKPGPETMCFPAGLALDTAGRYLLVADSLNARVLAFDVSGPITSGMPATAAVTLPGVTPSDLLNAPIERKITGAVAVAVDRRGQVFVSDRAGLRVLVYRLEEILAGRAAPLAAVGRFEMSTDLGQTKPGYGGPTGLAVAGDSLYVAEPRGNHVLRFDAGDPERRAADLLGQFYGNDLTRPNYHKYGPNNGPDPYGFDFADGQPALSVTQDGGWLLAADPIGGRLPFFPLGADGLPLDRSARLALGVPTLDSRTNGYGAARFNRPGHTVLTADGRLFASFQGSRILYFELPNLVNATGRGALDPLRPFVPPQGRSPFPREDFESRSVDSGIPALHVLGQVDFATGLRGTASRRQMGKEISGLDYDRRRGRLFVAEKLNHRVLIVDVRRGVETFMPASVVLGQPDFDSNAPNWGDNDWHPRGLTLPSGLAYDHVTSTLFVTSGEGRDREILGFDLSGEPVNGMEPALRIGGPHATTTSNLPRVEPLPALDEGRRRLWNGLFALDLSDEERRRVPLIGWFGLGPQPEAAKEQDTHSGQTPSLLGYSVGGCHRFGGAVHALAVNPRIGTVYAADNPRYRVLCFAPRFRFRESPLVVRNGEPTVDMTDTGGLAPLRFTVVEGRLPAGLELEAGTGLVRGVPHDGTGALLRRDCSDHGDRGGTRDSSRGSWGGIAHLADRSSLISERGRIPRGRRVAPAARPIVSEIEHRWGRRAALMSDRRRPLIHCTGH